MQQRLDATWAELDTALPSGESVWFASHFAIPLMIVVAGNGDHVHSLRVTVRVTCSERQNKRVFDTVCVVESFDGERRTTL
jgi:hypothetical protein